MLELTKMIGLVWLLAGLITLVTGCGAVEIYGGVRRTDAIEVRTTTTAPKGSWTDAITNWLFVDHSKEGNKA